MANHKALISLLYPAIHSDSVGKTMKRYEIPELFDSAIECNGCVIKIKKQSRNMSGFFIISNSFFY